MNFMLFYDKKLYRILPGGLKLERAWDLCNHVWLVYLLSMSRSSNKVSSHLLKKIVFSLFRNKIWNYMVKIGIDYLFRKISLFFV